MYLLLRFLFCRGQHSFLVCRLRLPETKDMSHPTVFFFIANKNVEQYICLVFKVCRTLKVVKLNLDSSAGVQSLGMNCKSIGLFYAQRCTSCLFYYVERRQAAMPKVYT